ncbi:UNVERIFIED_CONTAM: hypothetical protein K2H54_013842 [Gekko kuhli]
MYVFLGFLSSCLHPMFSFPCVISVVQQKWPTTWPALQIVSYCFLPLYFLPYIAPYKCSGRNEMQWKTFLKREINLRKIHLRFIPNEYRVSFAQYSGFTKTLFVSQSKFKSTFWGGGGPWDPNKLSGFMLMQDKDNKRFPVLEKKLSLFLCLIKVGGHIGVKQ